MARNVMTNCRTEIICRCFTILDRVSQGTDGRSCKAERMLEPEPTGFKGHPLMLVLNTKGLSEAWE